MAGKVGGTFTIQSVFRVADTEPPDRREGGSIVCQVLALGHLIYSSPKNCDRGVISPILPLGKLGPREGKSSAHEHTAGMGLDSHLGMPPGLPLQAFRQMEQMVLGSPPP